jgi:hypothetical protein
LPVSQVTSEKEAVTASPRRRLLVVPAGIARLRKLAAEPAGGSPEDMQAHMLAETEKWGKVAKFAGIKPQ